MRNILFFLPCFFILAPTSPGDRANRKPTIKTVHQEKMDLPNLHAVGKGRTVLLDYYFNNEYKKDSDGHLVRYHYTWEDQANSGFSGFGNIFRLSGAITESLQTAPTRTSLDSADVYIIVDPDTEKETASPHFVSSKDADVIYEWVRSGGVLLLMGNDSANAEFLHFNQLAGRFGIQFNEDCRNRVTGNHVETGAFYISDHDVIFRTAKKIFIKEMSTLRLQKPANSAFSQGGDIIMAVSRVGKGTVFAVGDPWFYNEYLDRKNLPAGFENDRAAKDLAEWLLLQSKKAGHAAG